MVENITWKQIMEADNSQLQSYCDDFGLSDRGDEDHVRERLLRHILSISLPSGELLLQGKININKASADEMRLWPFMGDTLVRNIIDYRRKYERFYKIDDLMNVKGVGENLFKRISQFIDVSGKTHIKVAKDVRVDADLELIKLEDEIRQKAWEIRNIQDNLNIDMDSLASVMTNMRGKEGGLSKGLKDIDKFTKNLSTHEKRLSSLRGRLQKKFDTVKDLEKMKKQEISELRAERLRLEEILPWKFIITSDLENLQEQCEGFGLSPRGDEASLRDRLMRHILNIKLPLGEFLLEGKLNINTATPEEMSLWPYMGTTLVKNVNAYRTQYGGFYKVEDLMNVKGVGENLFRKLVQFVDVSGKTHIKVKRGTRADSDMALIRLEDDIRNKAWELQDLRDHIDIDIDYLRQMTDGLESERDRIGDDMADLEEAQAQLLLKEKDLEDLRSDMSRQLDTLAQLRENSEDAYQNLVDLREEAEKNQALIEEQKAELEDQKGQLEEERSELNEMRSDIQDEKRALEEEKEEVTAIKDKLDEGKGTIMEDTDAFRKQQEDIDAKMKAIEEKEEEIDSQSREIEDKERDLDDRAKEIDEVADRIGMNLKSIDEQTVDIPIMVMRDPDDMNPEDDRVILESTDWLIQKTINVYYEGEKLSDDYSQVIFRNVPIEKSYNILVDTGERKYILMKNFKPGGEEL